MKHFSKLKLSVKPITLLFITSFIISIIEFIFIGVIDFIVIKLTKFNKVYLFSTEPLVLNNIYEMFMFAFLINTITIVIVGFYNSEDNDS